jgi:hypothetical protein
MENQREAAMPDASTIDVTPLAHHAPESRWKIVIQDEESLRHAAELTDRVPVYDQAGRMVGEFVPIHVWDDATGTPAEDAEDIRRAELAMQEKSIPWEDIKAELGL